MRTKSLEVVTNDPLNYFAFEEVRQLTGCQVVIRLSEMGPLQSAIRYYYAEVGAQQAAQTANEDFAERNVEMLQVEESESGDLEAPIGQAAQQPGSTVPSAPAQATCISSRLRAVRACACVSTARSSIM